MTVCGGVYHLFPGKVHHSNGVAGVGEELLQQVGGLQPQTAVVAAGVAGKQLCLLHLAIHDAGDLMLCVISQTQHTGGAGSAADEFLHQFRRREG